MPDAEDFARSPRITWHRPIRHCSRHRTGMSSRGRRARRTLLLHLDSNPPPRPHRYLSGRYAAVLNRPCRAHVEFCYIQPCKYMRETNLFRYAFLSYKRETTADPRASTVSTQFGRAGAGIRDRIERAARRGYLGNQYLAGLSVLEGIRVETQ